MKKRGTGRGILFVFSLAMTLLTFGLPSRTFAQATNTIIPIQGSFPVSFFNECTGEQVSGTGSVTGQIHTTNTGQNFHFSYHQTFQAEAVGQTSGTKYVGPRTDHQSVLLDGPFEIAETFTLNFQFISADSSDNLILHVLVHTTVNANGEATSFIDITSLECRG